MFFFFQNFECFEICGNNSIYNLIFLKFVYQLCVIIFFPLALCNWLTFSHSLPQKPISGGFKGENCLLFYLG